jgi:DNA-binding XRE family transcriptional regulator
MADFVRGEQLVKLRGHVSQEKAASEIGVSAKSLRAWEKGGSIRWYNAEKLAAYYEVAPESLVIHESVLSTNGAPDLMGALASPTSQLDRVEAMLEAIMAHLKISLPDASPGATLEAELAAGVQSSAKSKRGNASAGRSSPRTRRAS